MATTSFTTNHKFSKKASIKLLTALENSEDEKKDVLAPPNNVKYIKRTDKKTFDAFIKKVIDK